MKYKTNINYTKFSILIGTVILVANGTLGCGTSRQTTNPKAHAGPKGASSHHSDPIQQPKRDASQTCRATLHQIEGVKRVWALENRKLDSTIPTDADLFGPGTPMQEKPKCPSGGTYTLRAVEEPPLCSIAGHVY